MKLLLKFIVLFGLFLSLGVFANDIEQGDLFVLDESSFFVAYTPSKDSIPEYQGIIRLDDSFQSKSVLATICYREDTYQFIASVEYNKIKGIPEILIDMAKLCRKFKKELSRESIDDIMKNCNILVREL